MMGWQRRATAAATGAQKECDEIHARVMGEETETGDEAGGLVEFKWVRESEGWVEEKRRWAREALHQ